MTILRAGWPRDWIPSNNKHSFPSPKPHADSTGTGDISPTLKQSWGQTYYLTPSKIKAKNVCLYLHSAMRLHAVAKQAQDCLLSHSYIYYQIEQNGLLHSHPGRFMPEGAPSRHCKGEISHLKIGMFAGNWTPSIALPNHPTTEVESTFQTWQPKYILNVYSPSIQE